MAALCDTPVSIRRVLGPADIAALTAHLVTNVALTHAKRELDGGRQLVER
jgi:hypothetical protein